MKKIIAQLEAIRKALKSDLPGEPAVTVPVEDVLTTTLSDGNGNTTVCIIRLGTIIEALEQLIPNA